MGWRISAHPTGSSCCRMASWLAGCSLTDALAPSRPSELKLPAIPTVLRIPLGFSCCRTALWLAGCCPTDTSAPSCPSELSFLQS